MHSKLYLCETCPFQTKYYHNLISHIWKTYILFISNAIVDGISNSKMEAFGHKIEIEKSQLIVRKGKKGGVFKDPSDFSGIVVDVDDYILVGDSKNVSNK